MVDGGSCPATPSATSLMSVENCLADSCASTDRRRTPRLPGVELFQAREHPQIAGDESAEAAFVLNRGFLKLGRAAR